MSSLSGITIGISISDAPDRAKLGFPAREVDRAMFSICGAIVRRGGRVLYGGNLSPEGYTFKIFRHLSGAYSVRGKPPPFIHLVPEPVIRGTAFDAFAAALNESGEIAETLISVGGGLEPVRRSEGGVLAGRKGGERFKLTDQASYDAWLERFPTAERQAGFLAARRALSQRAAGRVVMGGKMGLIDTPSDHFEGAMPGIIHETILSLQAGRPVVVVGAFGGAARDAAIALDLLPISAVVPRGPQVPSYDVAIASLKSLALHVPPRLTPQLSTIAADDRAEPLAIAVTAVLEDWLGGGVPPA